MGSRAPWVVLMSCFGACQAESCKPQEVGVGLARLTVRNAGVLTRLVSSDTACGFESGAVLASPIIEGTVGTVGTVTWRVTGCRVAFPEPTAVLKSCSDVETRVTGAATFTGTRTVKGTLTGNPKRPVIPASPDAVRLSLEATFENFVARSSNSPNALTVNSGKLAWVAEPLLAVSASRGVCAIPTPVVTLSELKYEDATVFVESNGRQFSTEIASSAYSAQVGTRGDKENWLAGELTVYGKRVVFPAPGESAALDPAWDPAAFAASWACTPDLKQPVGFVCPSLHDQVAQGAARLTVSAFGRLVDFFDEEKTCGFASPAVLGGVSLVGNLGERGGTATWTIATPCRITFAEPTAVKTDCFGAITWLEGTVSVTGTKKVSGILTGDPAQPVIPTSREPGRVEVTFDFQNLRLSDSVSSKSLTVVSGTLSGALASRTGLDTELGACSIKTPVATISALKYQGAKLLVGSDGDAFALAVSGSNLDAQTGTRDGVSNELGGTLVIDGKSVAIPTEPGARILDPDFNPAHFEGAYACTPRLKVVTSDEECTFTTPLAVGAARLLVQSVGTLGALVSRDTGCGFDATAVKLLPSQVVGNAGQPGSMSWTITSCPLGQVGAAQLDQDCTGARRMVSGTAKITARRTVTGLREKKLLFIDSIIPTARDAVELELTQVQLAHLAAYSVPAGASAPSRRLTLHSGTLSAVVRPVLGERRSEPGTFDVPTPIASITELRLTSARVTLESGPKRFVFDIPSTRLTAFNGSFGGVTNQLEGTVELAGKTVTLAPMALNPDFAQAAFDGSYACTADLKALVPPNGP